MFLDGVTNYKLSSCFKDKSIGELKIRFQDVVERLKQLITRVSEKTELAIFLIDICQVSLFEINDFHVQFI